MDAARLSKIVAGVRDAKAIPDDILHKVLDLVAKSIEVESDTIRMRIEEPETNIGFIVLRSGRTGPSKSFKMVNVTREISRTVYLTALVGAASFAGSLATIISILYALFSVTSANVNFNDACLLHKAWKLARANDQNFVTVNQMLSVRMDMVAEYSAPKLQSETEVLDAIENLKGLKAMVEENGRLYLKEKIVCLMNGEIIS